MECEHQVLAKNQSGGILMCGNNCNLCNVFNGNNWWSIIILILLFSCCGCGNNGSNWNGCDNNNCGCC